jgi:hypothetical protein
VRIVTKLATLGRNANDVAGSVEWLVSLGVRVLCLALGGIDLTSPAGRMTIGVINAVAQFERDLLIERTQSGLKHAKAEGAVLGHPATLNEASATQCGESWSEDTDLKGRLPRKRLNPCHLSHACQGPPSPEDLTALYRDLSGVFLAQDLFLRPNDGCHPQPEFRLPSGRRCSIRLTSP